MLTETQKAAVLELARTSVAARVLGQAPAKCEGLRLPDASGVFVSIKRAGALRGCLGTLENRRGLAEEIVRCAAESASEDPRFAPITPVELSDLHVEVSVLGPLEPIDAKPDAFTIGIHGLVAQEGARRGVLLPQVAHEWGWTPEEFLSQTCIKAGLPANAWQHGAELYRFSAEVFGD